MELGLSLHLLGKSCLTPSDVSSQLPQAGNEATHGLTPGGLGGAVRAARSLPATSHGFFPTPCLFGVFFVLLDMSLGPARSPRSPPPPSPPSPAALPGTPPARPSGGPRARRTQPRLEGCSARGRRAGAERRAVGKAEAGASLREPPPPPPAPAPLPGFCGAQSTPARKIWAEITAFSG